MCLNVMLYVHCLVRCVTIGLNVSLNCTEFYVVCHKVISFFFYVLLTVHLDIIV